MVAVVRHLVRNKSHCFRLPPTQRLPYFTVSWRQYNCLLLASLPNATAAGYQEIHQRTNALSTDRIYPRKAPAMESSVAPMPQGSVESVLNGTINSENCCNMTI